METVYHIYIGDYHWETAIDKVGMAILWHEAKRLSETTGKAVCIVEKQVPFGYIESLQVTKYLSICQ